MTECHRKCYAEGFARGLLKCAGSVAADALENAARTVINPDSARTMGALGRDVFDAATRADKPLSSFFWSRLANPSQLSTIAATMKSFEHALSGDLAPDVRAAIKAKRDALLNPQFAELGTAAHGPIKFIHTAGPAAAAAGVTLPLAYAGGNIMGHRQQGDQDVSELENLPIHKRLQYALFPQTMLPQQPKPFYDRISGQTSGT
jgi:hypothetical protein